MRYVLLAGEQFQILDKEKKVVAIFTGPGWVDYQSEGLCHHVKYNLSTQVQVLDPSYLSSCWQKRDGSGMGTS